MVNAGPTIACAVRKVTWGKTGWGSDALRLPNRLAIVSTGRCSSCAATVAAIRATNGPGIRRLTRGQATSTSSVAAPRPAAAGETAEAFMA